MVVAQIPWATAQADRSRLAAAQSYPPDVEPPKAPQTTTEESLLASLLAANEELQEAFRIYNELEQVGRAEREEREVQARSLQETRMDRSVRLSICCCVSSVRDLTLLYSVYRKLNISILMDPS